MTDGNVIDAMESSAASNVMTLRSTLTSPYGRKTRLAALHLGLSDRIRIEPADTLDDNDTLRQQNPLGKMPCLLTEIGAIYDSRTILEFFDDLAGGGRIIPRTGAARWRTLTLATLCDGLTDAALLMVYERRFRDPSQISERWLSHQAGKVHRALSALVAAPPDPRKTDVASISLACGLGYLDWRKPLAWRDQYPALVAWLDTFASHEPAFAATERPL